MGDTRKRQDEHGSTRCTPSTGSSVAVVSVSVQREKASPLALALASPSREARRLTLASRGRTRVGAADK